MVRAVVSWGRLTGGALCIVTAALLGLLFLNLQVFGPRLDRALDATRVLRESHDAMLDQQTGLRGFLLTKDSRFLEAYERGIDALAELTPRATTLVSGDGRAGELFLAQRLSQQAWIDRWATKAIETDRNASGEIDATFLEQDKVLFDAYRNSHEQLIAQLVARRAQLLDAQRLALLTAIGVALAVTGSAGAIGWGRSQSVRRAVGEPLIALHDRVGQIGRGDLAARTVTNGPAEFQLLAKGLEETAAALSKALAVADSKTAEIRSRSDRQGEVLRLARQVAGSLSLSHVLRGVGTHAAAAADGARAIVWLLDDHATHLEAAVDSIGPDLQPIGIEARPLGEGNVGRSGRHARVCGRSYEDDANDLAVPMVVGGRVIGVLQFTGPQVPDLSDDAVEILETLAIHAATAIEAARLHELTAEMAETDALTGLSNRRRLDADLKVECSASVRYGRPLTFMMIDVDKFKSYNDDFGHSAGDAALQALANVLAEELRDSDSAYRYGGEEFAVILRDTAPLDAKILAERLRAAVERRFATPGQLRLVTISVGVAGFPDDGPTAEILIAAADGALYDAKNLGRNRVSTSLQPVGEQPEGRAR